MELSNEAMRAVERVVKDRMGARVVSVKIDVREAEHDELVLYVTVEMKKDSTAGDFSGKFFGLTRRVRDALGDDMRDVFPIIRPVEAHA